MPYAKPNTSQTTLFDEQEGWESEWQDMPEFRQENLLPEFSVRVNFSSIEDLTAFAQLVGQPITSKTQSIWYPPQQRASLSKKKYVDEASLSDLHSLEG